MILYQIVRFFLLDGITSLPGKNHHGGDVAILISNHICYCQKLKFSSGEIEIIMDEALS